MSKVLVTESYLTDIGNAIRAKNKSTTKYKPSEMADAISAISVGDSAVVVNSDSAWKYKITQKEHENITVNVSHEMIGDNTFGYQTKMIFTPAISSNYGYNAGAIKKTVDEENHVANFTADDVTEVDGLLNDGWAGIYVLNSSADSTVVNYYFNDYNNHSSSKVSTNTSIENLLILGYYTEDSSGNLVSKTKSNEATYGPSTKTSLKKYQNKYATQIRNNGFDCCSVSSVDIPNATIIGDYALNGCTYLNSVNLSNATNIGNYAFSGCTALTSIDLPNATDVGIAAFNGCSSLASVSLPKATTIGETIFSNCKALTSVDIPNATSINVYAFQNCSSLASIDLPKATGVGQSAFAVCTNLATVNIPKATGVGQSAFSGCTSLTSINLPSVAEIGAFAFQNCSSLESIDLPNITSIGTSAFYISNRLKNVYLRSETMCTCKGSPNFTTEAVIYVPESLLDSYKTATYWSNYASQFKTLESIKLTKISIIGGKSINTYNGNTTGAYKVKYNDGVVNPGQAGVTWSITGNATISQDGVVTLKNASVGDTLTITATSTYDTSISASLTVSVVNVDASMTVDLNNGQWVDTGTIIDGHTVYKSNAGSYNTNNGKSTCTVTVKGYSAVTVYIRSYAESNYDYTEVGPLDGTVSRGSTSSVVSTKGRQSDTNYYSYTFEINDTNTHTFQVLYSKDNIGNSNDDRGYFYVVAE